MCRKYSQQKLHNCVSMVSCSYSHISKFEVDLGSPIVAVLQRFEAPLEYLWSCFQPQTRRDGARCSFAFVDLLASPGGQNRSDVLNMFFHRDTP